MNQDPDSRNPESHLSKLHMTTKESLSDNMAAVAKIKQSVAKKQFTQQGQGRTKI